MKFYRATALRTLSWTNGITLKGRLVYVAKWEKGLYVIAQNKENFFVVTEKDASEMVKTERNYRGELISAPSLGILPQGPKFTWHVEAGSTCPDGCCGDDCPSFEQEVKTKEEAFALAIKLESGDYSGKLCFVRVLGPGFHQYHRNPID